jgi:hypothetical protein
LIVLVWSGRSQFPWIVTPVTTAIVAGSNSPISLSITGITANNADDIAVIVPKGVHGASGTLWALTAPSGYGNVINAQSANDFTPVIEACSRDNVAAGATGTLTATNTGETAFAMGYGAWVLSLAAGNISGGSYVLQTPKWNPRTRRPPFLRFGQQQATPVVSGSNIYSLSLATTTYALTIESVAQQIALGSAVVTYTTTPQAATLNTALVAATTQYALTIESITASRAVTLQLATTSYALTLENVTFNKAVSVALATAPYALTIENAGLTYSPAGVTPPPVVTETPAGSNQRFVRYIFKIDGKEFATFDLQQALTALDKAKQLAKKHAADLARAATDAQKARIRPIKLPVITGNRAIQKAVEATKVEIKAIYDAAIRDAEIAMLIEVIKRNDDSEDATLLLM